MNFINEIIVNKYLPTEIIGKGKFGTIYKGKNIRNGEHIAIKTEYPEQTLKHETKMLNYLYSNGCRDIPPVYWYGIHNLQNSLIIPLYELSLEEYRELNYQMFSKDVFLKKINQIMIKCIDILENIHYFYVLHRDIKPQNFMIHNKNIFLIDFGLSTFFMDENGKHVECSQKTCIIGTVNYISPNIHIGKSSSRRDDLISLGYIYMYLLSGSLPWSGIETNEMDDYNKLHVSHQTNMKKLEMKTWSNLENILKDYGEKIQNYMHNCYFIDYDESPNYTILKSLFE